MKFLFLIFLFPLQLFAQDVSGVWIGNLYNDTTKQYIPYELAINDFNGKFSGYSYTIFIIDSIKNVGVKSVKIKKQNAQFLVEDEKLIYNNYPEPPAKGVKTFSTLSFYETDSTQVLSGSWNTNRTKEYNSLTGTIFLEKKKKIKETLIVPKLDEMGLLSKLSFIPSGFVSTKIEKEKNVEKTSVAVNEKPVEEKKIVTITEKINPANIDAIKTGPTSTALNVQQPKKIEKEKNPEKSSFTANENRIEEKNVVPIDQNNTANINVVKPGPNSKTSNVQQQKEIEKEKNPEKSSFTINEKPVEENKIVTITEKNNPANIDAIKTKTNSKVLNVQQPKELGKEKSTEKSSFTTNEKPVEEKKIVTISKINHQENIGTNKPESKSTASSVHQQKELEKEKNVEKTSSTANEKPAKEKNITLTEKNNPKNIDIIKIESNSTASNVYQSKVLHEEKKIEKTLFVPNEIFKKEIFSAPAAAEIATRTIETIQTVEVKQDSLIFSLFDNGIVDGDTVSILINGKVVWPRVGLREQSTNKTIYLTPDMGDSIFVVMYAENLGSIPPNTGLLVIREGNIDHEIRFSGDLKKNSAIILKRKKKD